MFIICDVLMSNFNCYTRRQNVSVNIMYLTAFQTHSLSADAGPWARDDDDGPPHVEASHSQFSSATARMTSARTGYSPENPDSTRATHEHTYLNLTTLADFSNEPTLQHH